MRLKCGGSAADNPSTMAHHSSERPGAPAPVPGAVPVPGARTPPPQRRGGRHAAAPVPVPQEPADGFPGSTPIEPPVRERAVGPAVVGPRTDAPGERARCPRCRARVRPGDAWCGQCHEVLATDPTGGAGATAEAADADAGGAGTTSPDPGTSPPVVTDLVGGQVPEELLTRMVAELSVDSGPALPGRLATLGRGRGRVGLALAGGLAVVTLSLLVLGVLGLFL